MKKLALSFIISLFSFTVAQAACCTYIVDMQDSFGDGWNGGSIDIYVNGIFQGNYTIPTGSINTATFSACDGDNIQIYYNSGSWDSEVSFQIQSPGGQVGSYSWPSAGLTYNGTGDCSTTGGGGGGSPNPGGTDCSGLEPICTDIGLNFTANTGLPAANVADPGNNYDCLFSQPNPSWYYIDVATSGNIDMNLSAPSDIDFIIYGPFADLTAAQNGCGNYGYGGTGGNVIDCSFSGTNNEFPSIPGAVAGQVYVMLITNYASVVQDISLSQVGGTGSTDCANVFPCNVDYFSVNIGACDPATGLFTLDGEVDFTDAPTTGQLIVTDCNGNQQVFNAPFTSPTFYNIPGVTADGAACDITVFFSDDPTCTQNIPYTNPAPCNPPCNISYLDVAVGNCDATTNTFDLTGEINFANAPAGGQLIVEDCNGNQQVFNPPFVSPTFYNITGINADGTVGCAVTAYFTSDPTCTLTTPTYDNPANCACTAEIGTFTTNITGSSTNNYVLCYGDQIDITSNGDWVAPGEINPPDPQYDPGVTWLIYSCPPTVALTPDPVWTIPDDPCLLGVATDFDIFDINDPGSWMNAFAPGTFTDNVVYFVPITMYSMSGLLYSNVTVPNLPCYELGTPFPVQYLPEFTFSYTEDCLTGEAVVTVNGGLPELDGSNFTASNLAPANASFSNTTATDGGTITIIGLNGGDNWSFTVDDGNGCPYTVTGGPFPPLEDPGFNYPQNSYCQSEAGSAPIISGTGGGTFTSSPAGLNINASTGFINPGASTVGTYSVTYTTPGACFDDSTVTITIGPNPTVDPIADQTICEGDPFTAINFTGTAANFDWNNDNTTIGIGFNGSGNISSFIGTGTVTGGADNVANFTVTPSTGVCVGTPESFTLTVQAIDDPSFTYPQASYCSTEADPSATITGTTGGTFTASPAGMVINATTGTIDLDASTPGTYDVTYTTTGPCPDQLVVQISIAATPSVDPIADQTVCDGDPFTAINFTGSSGSVFSWTNSNTNIGLGASGSGNIGSFNGSAPISVEAGLITVTPTAGSCVGTPETFTLTVNPLDDPTFSYPQALYCSTEPNPTATITGDPGGTFTVSPAGLSINAATGTIDLAASTPNTYDVTYTTAGACPQFMTVQVTVAATPVVDPIADQTVCDGTNFADVIFTGSSGATFDWTNTNTTIGLAGGGTGNILAFTGTGTVLGSGVSETGTITVTPSAGTCVGTPETFTLTVDPIDDATFNYPASSYCTSEPDPTATITGNTGGTFTFTVVSGGPFLDLNASTGEILLLNSDPGTYDVTYTTAGPCPASSTFTVSVAATPTVDPIADQTVCEGTNFADVIITGSSGTTFNWVNDNTNTGLAANGTGNILAFAGTTTGAQEVSNITVTPTAGSCVGLPQSFVLTVNPLDDPTFSYPATSYCTIEADPSATVTGTPGGTFTASPAGMVINPVNGSIDLDASAPNTYDVTYTTPGLCPQSMIFTVSIAATPTVDPILDQTVCDGTDFTTITFTGSSGSSFNWTNDNAVIGLGANGSGNITAFTGTGTVQGSGVSETSNVVVTPVAGSCVGPTESFTLTVNPLDDPAFSYPASSYCSTETDPTATITGTPGGTFTASPAGMVINAATGTIDLDASTPNTYDVTYTTPGVCPQTFVFTVSIAATPSVNPIANQAVCEGDPFTDVIFTGSSGTTFDWTNDNTIIGLGASGTGNILSFNGTGTVQGSGVAETANIVVTPTAGSCVGTTETFTLTVNPLDDPVFNYSAALYCADAADPSANVTGTPGGTFTASPAGMTIDPATGLIDLSASTAGVYDITYTTPGICPQTMVVQVEVAAVPDVNPIADQTVCDGTDFTAINFTGSVSGTTFGWTNDNTNIGLGANGIGNIASFTSTTSGGIETANIVVTPSTATCIGPTTSFVLTVNPLDDPSFNYPGGLTYCQTGTDPVGNITGMGGGTFTYVVTSGGPTLDIDPATGDIVLANSDIGIYTITYNTVSSGSSLCPQQSSLTLTITDAPAADFTLDVYCADDSDPMPTFIGSGSGGTFTFSPAGLSINSGTGLVDLSASTPGTYTVTNTINVPGCATATYDDDITINELPMATISGNATVCPGFALPDVVVDITAGSANWDLMYNFNGSPVNAAGITTSPYNITGAAGTYDLVSITDGNGCTSTLAGQVVQAYYVTPVVDPLVNQEICEGTNLNVQGFSSTPSGSTFDWVNTTGIDVGFGLSGTGNIGIFQGVNGTGADITVQVSVTPTSADGCIGSPATFNITVHPTPIVDFTVAPASGCEPLNVVFTNLTVPSGVDCTWDFGNGIGTGCGTVSNTYMAGTYDVSLTVVTADGCIGSTSYNNLINVTPMPVAAFTYSPQEITIDDTEVEFTNNSIDADTYEWTFGDDTPASFVQDPLHIFPQEAGSYEVMLIASNNNGLCVDTAIQVINIQDVLIFYVPNVFTPDHDDFNEMFQPIFTSGYDPFDFHLMIFNRWGELIFESYNADIGWDGTYSDQGLVEDGVYVWKIDFKETMSDKRHVHYGHVTVLK